MINSDFAGSQPGTEWEGSAAHALRDAPVVRGFVTVVLPPAPRTAFSFIPHSYSDWAIAQSTGQVALLPLERAKLYDRLEYEAAEYIRISTILSVEETELHGVLSSLNVGFDPGETLHLDTKQRDELVRLFKESSAVVMARCKTRLLEGSFKSRAQRRSGSRHDRSLRDSGNRSYQTTLASLKEHWRTARPGRAVLG